MTDTIIKNVYLPKFHSSLIENEIYDVPSNCIIVNTSECGFYTYFSDEYKKKINELFNKNDIRLEDPIKYKSELEEEMGTKLAIYTSNSVYLNKYMNMSMTYDLIPNDLSKKMSIEDKQSFLGFELPCGGLNKMGNKCDDIIIKKDEYNINNVNKLTLNELETIYRNSLIPTLDNIIEAFSLVIKQPKKIVYDESFNKDTRVAIRDFINQLNKVMGKKLTLKNMLETYPGIYYITSCRSSHHETIPQSFVDIREKELKSHELDEDNIFFINYNLIKVILENSSRIKYYEPLLGYLINGIVDEIKKHTKNTEGKTYPELKSYFLKGFCKKIKSDDIMNAAKVKSRPRPISRIIKRLLFNIPQLGENVVVDYISKFLDTELNPYYNLCEELTANELYKLIFSKPTHKSVNIKTADSLYKLFNIIFFSTYDFFTANKKYININEFLSQEQKDELYKKLCEINKEIETNVKNHRYKHIIRKLKDGTTTDEDKDLITELEKNKKLYNYINQIKKCKSKNLMF